jgi:cobalt/nickel transport system permease protein
MDHMAHHVLFMHIPDGFLSIPVSIGFWLVSILVIAVALRKTSRQMGEREIPLMGVLAAAIFAGQMLNFSVTGGTSGHLLGAALAVILVGPWGAVLVMTCVVSTQAILFQDGGLLALGTNLFNMAVVGVFVSYVVLTLMKKLIKDEKTGLFVGSGLAAWTSIFFAALACALELAISGTSPANLAIPAMASIHALIGIGEALITVGAVSFIFASRKELILAGDRGKSTSKGILIGGGAIAIVLAVLSPLASRHPDGLEWVAGQQGFLSRAQAEFFHLIPNYTLPGISNQTFATILAAIIGVTVVFSVALGVAKTRKRTVKE